MSRKKGDSHLLCEAPFGPFRQKVAVTFFAAAFPGFIHHAALISVVLSLRERNLLVERADYTHFPASAKIDWLFTMA